MNNTTDVQYIKYRIRGRGKNNMSKTEGFIVDEKLQY